MKLMKVGAALGLLLLGACGQSKSLPPTDDEITQAMSFYWSPENTHTSGSLAPGMRINQFIEVVAAKKIGNSTTVGPQGMKQFNTGVVVTFRAVQDILFDCSGASSMWFDVEPKPENTGPMGMARVATKGSTFECTIENVTFDEVDEGWTPRVGGLSWNYLIKR